MSIFKEVFSELLSMFITDARLTLTTLLLVGLVAALTQFLHVQSLIAGLLLICGCVLIIIEAALRETRKTHARKITVLR
jgi:hypothetical protein